MQAFCQPAGPQKECLMATEFHAAPPIMSCRKPASRIMIFAASSTAFCDVMTEIERRIVENARLSVRPIDIRAADGSGRPEEQADTCEQRTPAASSLATKAIPSTPTNVRLVVVAARGDDLPFTCTNGNAPVI